MQSLRFFEFKNIRGTGSFEILSGDGRVMLSVPHVVEQLRDGRRKTAETHTGPLAEYVFEKTGCPVIYKRVTDADDPNDSPESPYREALVRFLHSASVRYLIDLHELDGARPQDFNLGTGKGANLEGDKNFIAMLTQEFSPIGRVFLDKPFAALGDCRVATVVAERCGVPSVQFEINSRLLTDSDTFLQIGDALSSAVKRLSELPGEREGRGE